MDNLTNAQRRFNMSQIKSSNTSIEKKFIRLIYKSGIRGYRVNAKIIGKPDIFFPKKKITVFIDGCFWHKCPKCFIKPKSNIKYWNNKIKNNLERDKKINKEFYKRKIKVIRFWEHNIKQNPLKCFEKFKKVYETKT